MGDPVRYLAVRLADPIRYYPQDPEGQYRETQYDQRSGDSEGYVHYITTQNRVKPISDAKVDSSVRDALQASAVSKVDSSIALRPSA